MKLNIDAMFDPNSMQGAVGAMMRDSNGNFLVVVNEKIEACYEALTTRSTSLRFGWTTCHAQFDAANF